MSRDARKCEDDTSIHSTRNLKWMHQVASKVVSNEHLVMVTQHHLLDTVQD
jgi:hypothetical protein